MQFRDAMRAAGLTPPDKIEPDGKRHRFSSNGKRDDDGGFYTYHGDGIPAGHFGDWRKPSEWQKWRADIGRKLTPAEDAAHRAKVDAMEREREAERGRRQIDAASKAAEILAAAPPAPDDHPYPVRKGIKAHGAKLHEGALVIPMRDADGAVHSLQFIGPDGIKRFLTGGRVKACYFLIGKPSDRICIAEGFATAASIHEATGHAVAIAFNVGNLAAVAQAIRSKYRAATLILCADDDLQTAGNPGLTAATAAAQSVGGLLAIPEFGGDRPAGMNDFNDLAQLRGAAVVSRCIARAAAPGQADAGRGTFPPPEAITTDEWQHARTTPDCIVQFYLYADVAVLIAPGGLGKTTLVLFEAIHIALDLPLYGLAIRRPGAVVIVTAEDSREMLIARLREIAQAMQLSGADIATVMQRVRISDTSGSGFKVTEIAGDVVIPAAAVDKIIEACRPIAPVLIVFDPAISFGVGEARVNDAEHALVEAGRKIRRALNASVRYVHHSGKQNARDRTTDQYSGRGGSAFSDGARMVHVLQSLTPDEWHTETGAELLPGETGLRLARPKMSYCAPVGDILIRRAGYRFTHVDRATLNPQARLATMASQIWQLLTAELVAGRYHSRNTIESLDTGLKRGEIRAALDWLLASRRIEARDMPNAGQRGRRSYLHPLASPIENGEPSEKPPENGAGFADEKTVLASPPPIGILTAAKRAAPFEPSLPYGSPTIDGEPRRTEANPDFTAEL